MDGECCERLFSFMGKFSYTTRNIIRELSRYKDHLTQDLKSLKLALQEKAPDFRHLIEKQIQKYRQELDVLSKSTLISEMHMWLLL